MALSYTRKVTYPLPRLTDVVISATADNTWVYLLTRDTASTSNRIYRLNKQGIVQSHITVPYDATNIGLAVVGNGFAFAKRVAGGNMAVTAVDNEGSTVAVVSFSVGYPLGLAYKTNRYIIFYHQLQDYPTRIDVGQYSSDNGTQLSRLRLSGITGVVATGQSEYAYYIATTETSKDLVIYDGGFAPTNDQQSLGGQYTDTKVLGLAYSQGQLIAVGESHIYFYGPEPPEPPVGPQPVRQIFAELPALERYDVVRTSPFEVIATNIEVLRSTSLSLAALSDTGTLTERLATAVVTPVWTQPDVKQGDKIFTHEGDETTEPSAIPTNRPVYTIDGILTVGNEYRQTFAVTRDTQG